MDIEVEIIVDDEVQFRVDNSEDTELNVYIETDLGITLTLDELRDLLIEKYA